jgi:DNA-binding transcriptional MerR regulator
MGSDQNDMAEQAEADEAPGHVTIQPRAGVITFTITDLADAFQVTPRAIRFYEDQGLIAPERRGQNRVYTKRDYARLAWVLRGRRVGFSLADIRELLDLYDKGDGRLTQRAATLAKCRAQLDALVDQRRDLDHMIDELETFCSTLENLVLGTPSQQTRG